MHARRIMIIAIVCLALSTIAAFLAMTFALGWPLSVSNTAFGIKVGVVAGGIFSLTFAGLLWMRPSAHEWCLPLSGGLATLLGIAFYIWIKVQLAIT